MNASTQAGAADKTDETLKLRDFFAGLAMLGHLASETVDWRTIDGSEGSRQQKIARSAYLMADAMLAEKSKAR